MTGHFHSCIILYTPQRDTRTNIPPPPNETTPILRVCRQTGAGPGGYFVVCCVVRSIQFIPS